MKNNKEKLKVSLWSLALSVFLVASLFLLIDSAFASTDIPTILPRAEWTKGDPGLENLLTWIPDKNNSNPPDYRPVERIIIHYTETPNSDNTKDVSISRIQAIYQYHAVTKRWGDIGYNYIIDRLGNVYEGRYGGNGVRGAHTYNSITKDNYNVGSVGIGLLGNYASEDPPEAMFTSLKKLVGWLAATNGFDPNVSSTSQVWNTSQQGLTTVVTLPNVIGHKDVDATSDSGIPKSKFNELRLSSQTFYNEYKNYVYQLGSHFYEIINGEKKRIFDTAGKTIVNLTQTQLDLFVGLSILQHPNHTLMRTANSGVVYLDDGYKRPIISPEIFDSRFNWSDVVIISQNEWDYYPLGDPVTLREGMLVRANGDSNIYVISDGLKRWISGPLLFENIGYKWNNVVEVSEQALSLSPLGEPIHAGSTHPNGALITSPGQGISLLEDGKKRPIPTPEIFTFNYKWKDIVSVSTNEWNQYGESNAIYYPEGVLLREASDHKVYVIENGKKRWITSPVLFSDLGYRWNNVKVVVDGGSGGMALGDNVSFESLNIAKN